MRFVKNMRNTRKIVLIVSLLLLLLIILLSFNLETPQTLDALTNLLRQEWDHPGDPASISYIDSYALDGRVLLWFSVQKEHLTVYRAMDCRLLKDGKYILREIHTPMVYSQNIVHTLWMGNDIFLVNDRSCSSIVYKDGSDKIVSKVDLPPNDIPYVFLDSPKAHATKMDFIDSKGNSIR